MTKYKVTIVALSLGIVLLLNNNIKLNNTIQISDENIRTINIENENLSQKLAIADGELIEYKNMINNLNEINKENADYIFYDIPFSISEQTYINSVCDKYNISYSLIISLIKVESDFDQWAVSSSNCLGLGQINQKYLSTYSQLAGLETVDPFLFTDNIDMTVAYLAYIREYLKSLGYTIDEDLTVMILGCYNKGVMGYLGHYKETGNIHTNYSDIILNYKMKLEQSQIN